MRNYWLVWVVSSSLWAQSDAMQPANAAGLAIHWHNKGVPALLAGDLAAAEAGLLKSVALKEGSNSGSAVLARTLCELGLVYYYQGRYSKAKAVYKRALLLREQTFGPDDPEVGHTLNKVGAIAWTDGRYSEAEGLWRRTLAIFESKAVPPQYTASVLNNLGRLKADQGHYEDAEEYLEHARTVLETRVGQNDSSVAITLTNLAEVKLARRQYDTALKLLLRALEINEGGPNYEIGRTLNQLADLHNAVGEPDKADAFHRRSIDSYEKGLGPSHPAVCSALLDYASFLRSQKRSREAARLTERARTITREHPDLLRKAFTVDVNAFHRPK